MVIGRMLNKRFITPCATRSNKLCHCLSSSNSISLKCLSILYLYTLYCFNILYLCNLYIYCEILKKCLLLFDFYFAIILLKFELWLNYSKNYMYIKLSLYYIQCLWQSDTTYFWSSDWSTFAVLLYDVINVV